MHIFQMGLGPAIDHPLLMNAVWCLINIIEKSGAMRVYPGSYKNDVAPPTFHEITSEKSTSDLSVILS